MLKLLHSRAAGAAIRALAIGLVSAAVLLGGCASPPKKSTRAPQQVHAQLLQILPARVADRESWASAFTDAFVALDLDASTSHLCAALAVAEQESGFVA